jgi:hypothetical protein
MVTSRGASDDACLDTNNQASPPRGDESNKGHENANRIDCKLNLNSVSADLHHPFAAKEKIESTARELPAIQLTNIGGLTGLSVNPLLTSTQDASNDNVRAENAFKNLLQLAMTPDTASKISADQISPPVLAFPVHAGSVEIATTPEAAAPTDGKDQLPSPVVAFVSHTGTLEIATASGGVRSADETTRLSPVLKKYQTNLLAGDGATGKTTPNEALAPVSGILKNDLNAAAGGTSKTLVTVDDGEQKVPPSPTFATHTGEVVLATTPAAATSIDATPQLSPLLRSYALAQPSSNVIADTTPTTTELHRTDAAAGKTLVTADNSAQTITSLPIFASRAAEVMVPTLPAVAPSTEQVQNATGRKYDGSLNSVLAKYEIVQPSPNAISDITPTTTDLRAANGAAVKTVTADNVGQPVLAPPKFASRETEAVLKTESVAVSRTEQAPAANGRQYNGALSSVLASYETAQLSAGVNSDTTLNGNHFHTADEAAGKTVTIETNKQAITAPPVFGYNPAEVVYKTESLAASSTEQAPAANVRQNNLVLPPALVPYDTPQATRIAASDTPQTAADLRKIDGAENKIVAINNGSANVITPPAFPMRTGEVVTPTESVAALPTVQTPDTGGRKYDGSLSPVLASYATPFGIANSGAKSFDNPAKLIVAAEGTTAAAFDQSLDHSTTKKANVLVSLSGTSDSQTIVQATANSLDKTQPQVIASTTSADQLSQAKNVANTGEAKRDGTTSMTVASRDTSVVDTSQFNSRYVGPGTTAATTEQSALPIFAAKRAGSGLARDAVEPGTNLTADAANGSKQFFALPGSGVQIKGLTADSPVFGTTANMAKEGITGKIVDTTVGAIAVENLKQLIGRQNQGDQTLGALAADALKIIIARQLSADLGGETSATKATSTAMEYKATVANQVAVGTNQIIGNASSIDNRPNESKLVSTNDLNTIRPTNLITASETTLAGSVIQTGIRIGTTTDAQIAQSINIMVGIGTGVTTATDGKTTLSDGKTSLVDSRVIGSLIPLPAEITNTKRSGETPTVLTGKDIVAIGFTETTGTKTVKVGDIVPGESSVRITTTKPGDKKDQKEDEEEVIKNVGTIAGAGGFGGGAANPTNDPNNAQTSQSTVTGTVVDPDQKMTLPNLKIVDGRVLPPGEKNGSEDITASGPGIDASSRVETETNIDTDGMQSRQDDVTDITSSSPSNNPTNVRQLSEIDRLFGITKTQPTDEDAAWQAGKWQAEFLSFERRRVYKIKRGESLADIARRELGNPDYVQLLVEINIDTLTFDRYGQIILTPGREIYLPSRADMLRFLAYQEQENKLLTAFVDGKNIDTNQQVVYACRLGDTLITVAKRHPAVRDARLWKLVAELNNLSTKKDKNGAPIARLHRGQHLLLPTAEQKSDYLHELAFGTKSKDLSSNFVRHIANDKVPEPKTKTTLGDKAITAEPDTSFKSRLISQSDLGDTGDRLVLRLELRVDGKFVPVVEYAIGFGSATLCVHTKNGDSKVTNIDLPNRSARELAESDLAANANLYCQNFENNVLPL